MQINDIVKKTRQIPTGCTYQNALEYGIAPFRVTINLKGGFLLADKGDELVRYITNRVVNYMDTPKEERRQHRELRRTKEAWLFRWFGVVPFALSMWLEQRKDKLKRR